jgi:hypothetical protein
MEDTEAAMLAMVGSKRLLMILSTNPMMKPPIRVLITLPCLQHDDHQPFKEGDMTDIRVNCR